MIDKNVQLNMTDEDIGLVKNGVGEGTPLVIDRAVQYIVKRLVAGSNIDIVDDGEQLTLSAGGVGGGIVSSVNGETGTVVLDPDDLDDSATTNKFASQAQLDKINNLTITQPVDLDTLETDSHTHANKAYLDGLDSFTEGSIPYSNSSGELIDDNNLRYDSTDKLIINETNGTSSGVVCNRTDGTVLSLLAGSSGTAFMYPNDDKFSIISASRANVENGIGVGTSVLTSNDEKIGILTDSPDYVLDFNSTDAIRFPSGTTAERPTANAAIVRFNSNTGWFEAYDGTEWITFAKQAPAVQNITADGTEDIDLNSRYSEIISIDVGAITASTVTLSNPVNGGVYTVHFKNISTTVDVTWPANCLYETGTALGTPQYSGGKMLTFYYDGTNFYTI